MALSVAQSKRREYPDSAEDFTMALSGEEGADKPTKQRLQVPQTDVFYLTFLDPNDGRHRRVAVSYGVKKTRILPVDLRNFEEEAAALPVMVQKELYYVRNPETGKWEDIKGAKTRAEHYADCTEDYYEIWRLEAYPKGSVDPFKGVHRPAYDPFKIRMDMQERQLNLMFAKEKGMVAPMALHNTSNGDVTQVSKDQFQSGAGPAGLANLFEYLR